MKKIYYEKKGRRYVPVAHVTEKEYMLMGLSNGNI